MTRFHAGLFFLAGLGTGLGIGLLWPRPVEERLVDSPVVVERQVVVDREVEASCPDCPDCPEPGAELDPVKMVKPDTTALRVAAVEERPAWQADWPADLTPSGFEREATAIFASCGFSFKHVGVDCEEPPCNVLFTAGHVGDEELARALDGCPAWRDRYGSTVNRWTRCSRKVDCGDGADYFYGISSQRALDLLAEEGFSTMDLKALQQERCDAAVSDFDCP